jgi:hypothetical protein
MIELISVSIILVSSTFLYIKHNTIHKNKIEFDLLKDRGIKELVL